MRATSLCRALLLIALLAASPYGVCGSEEAEAAEQEPVAEDAAADAAADDPAAEPVPLNCKPAELLEPIDTWSVDCAAQWLENMGFSDLKAPFIENGVDGAQLKELTLEKLADEYGVSEEASRKKIVYAIKDIVRKDNYKGNTNNWAQFFMWALPFLGIYKWLTVKYDKQITRMNKKYKKWQEARTPVEVVPPAAADDKNEWIAGVNADVGGGEKKKKEKRTKKAQ